MDRGVPEDIHQAFGELQGLLGSRHPRYGSGLQIDVTINGAGYRFASGSTMAMEDATGIPAAAGILLMLDRTLEEPGLYAPECVNPIDFFAKTRLVSTGGGGLHLMTLEDHQPSGTARIRDLLSAS